MSEALITAADQQRLNKLGSEIRALHNQTVMTAIEIGRRLQEAKEIAGHGHWGEWLEQNVGYSQTQATNLMHLYEAYGSGQIGLFGDTLPENIASLGVTKAIALLEIPAEEREAFVDEVGADELSTRELQAKVKEYKEAAEAAIKQADTAQRLVQDAQDIARESMDKVDSYKAQVTILEKQLKELESRPVEVAVESPSEEMLEQIRVSEEEKWNTEREKLSKQLKAAEKKLKDAEKKVAEAQAQDEENSKALAEKAAELAAEAGKAAQAKVEAAEARAEAAEKKLKASDTDAAQLKVYMQEVQENWNKARGLTLKADPEKREKFNMFMAAVLKSMEGSLS